MAIRKGGHVSPPLPPAPGRGNITNHGAGNVIPNRRRPPQPAEEAKGQETTMTRLDLPKPGAKKIGRRDRHKGARVMGDLLQGRLTFPVWSRKMPRRGPLNDIHIYVERHIIGLVGTRKGDPIVLEGEAHKRAERVLHFFLGDAEYRWPAPKERALPIRLGICGGCYGAILALAVAVVGVVVGLVAGAKWCFWLVALPLGVSLLSALTAVCTTWLAGRAYTRKLEEMWADPRGASPEILDFEYYPFANRSHAAGSQAGAAPAADNT